MRAWLPVVAALVTGSLPVAAARGAVDITVEPPAVARVEFDRRWPPRDMPADTDFGAVTSNVFEIEATVASSIEALSPTTVRVYPENFAIITRLKATIYLPKRWPLKLRAHEEGHRAIGEHYYGNAEAAARAAATSLIGRSFEGSGADRAAAERAASELVLAALRDAYMQGTHSRSAAAQTRYDTITDHGRRAMLEAEAVALAVADDP